MSEDLVREARFMVEYRGHATYSKILAQMADALEAQAKEIAELRAALAAELPVCWEAANQLKDPYTHETNDPRVELDRTVMVREGERIAAMGKRLQALAKAAG